ncbi:hypothetical protein ACUUL3_14905 [Thiovibrio sp. JS02]
MSNKNTQATEEQILYANILEKGMYLGLFMMVVTFALYVLRILPPVVPRAAVSTYWAMPVHDYLVAINTNFLQWEHLPTGWSWLKLIGYGDFLNFVPVAILSGVTIVCYLAIVPGLFARNDKAMGLMTLATAIILALAASGLLAVGH